MPTFEPFAALRPDSKMRQNLPPYRMMFIRAKKHVPRSDVIRCLFYGSIKQKLLFRH